MSAYTVDAVLAEHICDEATPRSKRKPWRVAFYKHGNLFAVVNRPFARVEAEKAAAAAEKSMAEAVERYITATARKDQL